MGTEYDFRLKRAIEINENLKELLIDLIIVGSVAYNPDAVTKKSDLDLVGVVNFSTFDFPRLYKQLGQPYESLVTQYASEGMFNNFSIVWDDKDFEIGLHLWDLSAWSNVTNLKGPNTIFCRDNFSRNFKSTAESETLKNLRGESYKFYKCPKKVSGGTLLDFFPFIEDDIDIYPGIQVFNLLLDPWILTEKNLPLKKELWDFEKRLRKKLQEKYGEDHLPQVNLYQALAPKLQKKVHTLLKHRLEEFF